MDQGVKYVLKQIESAYDLSCTSYDMKHLKGKINKVLHRIRNTTKTGDLLNYLKKFQTNDHRDVDEFQVFKKYNIMRLEEMYTFLTENYSDEANNLSRIKDLNRGDKYSNYDLMNTFLCSEQGGMRKSNRKNALILVTAHTKPLYSDKWDSNGILHYTGMGQKGDMDLNWSQNRTLNTSLDNGVSIYLFEVFNDLSLSKYTYRGEVKLVGKPYKEKQLGIDNLERNVWMFPIKPIKRSFTRIEDVIDSDKQTEKEVKKVPDNILNKIVTLKARQKPSEKIVISKAYSRDASVKEYTKRRANGTCELCNREAPFFTKNGEPYLEVHHIITLAENGPDSVINTVALCPNCHRKIHLAPDKKEKDFLINIILKDLLKDEVLYLHAENLLKVYTDNK